jgi:carbon storage regulator
VFGLPPNAEEGDVLVLSRKVNQAIVIGDDVRIVIVAIDNDQVKLGVEAPREVSVHRAEVYQAIKASGRPTNPRAPAAKPAPARDEF